MELAVNPDLWKATMAALVAHCGSTGKCPGDVFVEWSPSIIRMLEQAQKGITVGSSTLICGNGGVYLKTAGK